MIPLHTIRVASPCSAEWEQMEGDDQARFCNACRKNVYNLSEMTHAEAQALVNRAEGKLCVRFYTRADGTLLTQDCPVGLLAVRRKIVKKLSYAAALLLACASGLLRGAGAGTIAKKPMAAHGTAKTAPHRTLGKIALPKPPTPKLEHLGNLFLGGMMAPPVMMGAPTVSKAQK